MTVNEKILWLQAAGRLSLADKPSSQGYGISDGHALIFISQIGTNLRLPAPAFSVGVEASKFLSRVEGIMLQFGKRGGGGRRSAPRNDARLFAKMRTYMETISVELVDVSKTGAGLAGVGLPRRGTEFFLKVESMDVFGRVAWSAGTLCGVTFDVPLSDAELEALERETRSVRRAGVSPSEKVTIDCFYACHR